MSLKCSMNPPFIIFNFTILNIWYMVLVHILMLLYFLFQTFLLSLTFFFLFFFNLILLLLGTVFITPASSSWWLFHPFILTICLFIFYASLLTVHIFLFFRIYSLFLFYSMFLNTRNIQTNNDPTLKVYPNIPTHIIAWSF